MYEDVKKVFFSFKILMHIIMKWWSCLWWQSIPFNELWLYIFCNALFLGWNFVNTVMSSEQMFWGFVACQNSCYMRLDPNWPRFMSLRTFIDWFFAWASRMKIDFRQWCSHCGDKRRILACDAGFQLIFEKWFAKISAETGKK